MGVARDIVPLVIVIEMGRSIIRRAEEDCCEMGTGGVLKRVAMGRKEGGMERVAQEDGGELERVAEGGGGDSKLRAVAKG